MKSANKIINKPVEQWSVKEMNDFLCRLGMINLTHLDYDEKVKIVKVLQRDEIVLQTESERVLKLKYEVQDLKRRSAKKPGLNDKMCARCQAELGMFMNSGAECFKCHFIVCKNCRVIVTEDGKTWLCILCAKQAKLRTISGEWFYEKVSERLKPSMASYVHGSNFVRDSIRLKNRGGLMGRGSLGGVGRAGFISNSSSNSPVMSKRGSALEGGPMGREASVISAWQAAFPGLTSKSRTLSASGITSREITNAALDSSLIGAGAVGGGGENGATDFEDSASSGDHCFKDFASSKLSAEIQKGLQGMASSTAASDAVFSSSDERISPKTNTTTTNQSQQQTLLYNDSPESRLTTSSGGSSSHHSNANAPPVLANNSSTSSFAAISSKDASANSSANSILPSANLTYASQQSLNILTSTTTANANSSQLLTKSFPSNGPLIASSELGRTSPSKKVSSQVSKHSLETPANVSHHFPTGYQSSARQQNGGDNNSISSSKSNLSPRSGRHQLGVANALKHSQDSLSSESSTATLGSSCTGGARSKTSRNSGYSNGQPGTNRNKSPIGANQKHLSPKLSPAAHNNTQASKMSKPSSTLPSHAKQNETGNLAQVGTEAGLSVNDANTSHTLPSNLSSSSLRDTPGQRPVGSRKGSANQLRSPAHHLRSPGREGMVPGYPTMPPDFRMARRGRGGAGHMMSPYDPNDPYSMPYMHHHPHHHLGMRPPQHMLPHQYYMEPPGSLNRHFRGHGMIHGSGLRHPPGCYPADNTHQMILHKVELLNRHTRRKFLMPNVPPSQGQMSDEQFGSTNLQEYVSPDNSEHAATLSSESERSHRSHHVDDDLEDGQRRTDRGSFHKQNSSDNYEHEQPNRRSSLQGGTSEDSSTTNTTGANIQPAGSNSSLHTTGLELGAMPRSSGGYSCSVPATPEHRRYLPPGTDWASLSYAGHPGMPAHPAEFAMMRGRSRGVPYGYHPRNPRHPGPPTQGRMPFRHPSQYRSMPAHAAYGYYPRGRPRHMAPMYSSQEDFRGSSRSIAMYPGEYPPPTMDSNDPRLPVRRRIRGSRESLDGQSRESRGLSKSYPSENRSSSMPPAEDRLGDEDEAVLNRLADPALNSSHNVPSLINSLTSTGATLGSTITTTATVASAASKEPVGSRDRLSQHHKQHNNNNHQSITTAPSPPTFPQNQPTPSQQSLSSSPSSNTNTTHSEANRATVQTKGKKKDKGGGEDFAMDKENGEAASVYFQRARSVMDLSGSVQTSRKSKGKRRGVTAMLLSSFKTSSSKLDVSATEKESGLDPSSAQSVGNNSSLLNKSFSSSSQTINLEPSFESSGDRKHGGSFFGSLKWRSMRSLSGSQTSLASKDSLKDQLRKNSKRFGSQFSRKLSGRSGKGDEHSKDDTLSVGSGGQAAGSNSYSNSKQVKSTSSSSDQQVVALDADGAQKQVKGAPKSGRVNAKKLILGCVQFTCKYNKDKKMLEVGRLSCASLNSSGNKLCSAYVKLTLTQSNGKVSKMKTKPAKPSADPEYDELLQLAVEEKEVKKSSLLISVCNKVSSTLGKDALLGEVEVSLAKMKDLQSQSLQQFPLTIYAANESKDIGSMKLTVKFEPRKGLSIRVSATGLNKKASTEPNTFCKLHLLPMSKAFKSEEIVKKSANPVYLQTFFIPLNSVSLLDFCLEIGVFSVSGGSTAGTTSLKTFLGGVRLSDGTATCRGSLVEWMQSTSDEIDLWNRVQSSLGEWVQGHLRLRANFTPFK
ncbi:uncharacterized protein LOC142358757 isoform X2 [Convolutriloba macropyga]|uniref:uncharacterized protein LOC142358757 isoform X2 n=1 Tax=Convolutriloba macropyga TaxID=536237 RepID=UPI003F527F7C